MERNQQNRDITATSRAVYLPFSRNSKLLHLGYKIEDTMKLMTLIMMTMQWHAVWVKMIFRDPLL